MAATMTTAVSFPFVISDGPNVPCDARTLIRKQAMKDVGLARRKKGNHGQANQRQSQLFLSNQCSSTPSGDSAPTTVSIRAVPKLSGGRRVASKGGVVARESALLKTATTITDLTQGRDRVPEREIPDLASTSKLMWSHTVTLSAYERIRSKFGVEMTDFSAVTTFEFARSTSLLLSLDPLRITSLTGHHQWSYLQYIPARYGRTACLTAATDAYLAKIRTTLAPNSGCAAVCDRLYGVALCALQVALEDESTAVEADVLCATQLLGLYELLDSSHDMAWRRHLKGSVQLYKHRSPTRFTTEFEKALLTAHVGAIQFDAIVSGTHCWLEQPEWTDLYTSLAQDSDSSPFLSVRSSLVINIRASQFKVPNLWHDVGVVVNTPEYLDSVAFPYLEARCRQTHSELAASLEAYKAHCVALPFSADLPTTELELRRDLFGTVRGCLGILICLLATICVGERDTWMAEARALAHLEFDLQKQPAPRYSWLFSDSGGGMDSVALLTRDRKEVVAKDEDRREERLASREKLNVWRNRLATNRTLTASPGVLCVHRS